MKTLFALLILAYASCALAANPTFQSFDTNDFTANAAINSITANTSPLNPLALVTQAQLGAASGTTNGQTLAQVISIIGTNAVIQNGGTGSNTAIVNLGVTNTLSVTNGNYLNLWFSDGTFLRTNTIPPFDWFKHLTNGLVSYGTGSLAHVSFTLQSGITALRTLQVIGTAPATGKTNIILSIGLTGLFTTNDYATFVASLSGTGTLLPPNAVGVLVNNGSGLTNWSTAIPSNWINDVQGFMNTISNNAVSALPSRTNFYVATNSTPGFAVVIVGPDANGQFSLKGTNWPTLVPTNTMGGAAIDFGNEEATTNLAGALVLSSVANITAGVYNRKLIHVINNTGSDQTVTLTAGWGVGIADTFVSTNATRMNLWAEVQPGVFTNVFQKQVVTH